MVTLEKLNIQRNFSVEIQQDGNGELLLSSARYRGEIKECYENGGFGIHPQFKIKDVNYGFLYFIQEVPQHRFNCLNRKEDTVKKIDLKDKDGPIIDSPFVSQFYYKRHLIKDNVVNSQEPYSNGLLFYDAPYYYIEDDWTQIDYYLKFRTYLAWTNSIDDVKIINDLNFIASFEWYISLSAELHDGVWRILKNSFSSNEEILATLITEVDFKFNPQEFNHLLKNI